MEFGLAQNRHFYMHQAIMVFFLDRFSVAVKVSAKIKEFEDF